MSTPDIPLRERFERFQKSLKYLRTVTQGIRQTDELDRALEVALVRYSREERNGRLDDPMSHKRFPAL